MGFWSVARHAFSAVEHALNPTGNQPFTSVTFMPLLHPWIFLARLVVIIVRRGHSWVITHGFENVMVKHITV